MQILDFSLTAENQALGTVTLAQTDFSLTPLSRLTVASGIIPSTQLTTYLLPILTISHLSGGGGPQTMQAQQLMTLIGNNVLAFPPNNLSVNLQDMVPFGTSAITATLQSFFATMNTILV